MRDGNRTLPLLLLAMCALGLPAENLHGQRLPERLVTIRAAADDSFRAMPGWEQVIRSRISKVSTFYESNLGIGFVLLDVVNWSNSGTNPDQLYDNLDESVSRGSSDILVGFSGKEGWKEGNQIGGESTSFVPTVALFAVRQHDESRTWLVLAHEIAHVFGVWEEPNSHSVMSPELLVRFDDTAGEVFHLTRDFDFRKGVEQLSKARRLQYTELFVEDNRGHFGNRLLGPHIRKGDRALARGEYNKAVRQYRAAALLDPKDSKGHFGLGRALGMKHEMSQASEEFQQAIRFRPEWPEAHYNLALALAARGLCIPAVKQEQIAHDLGYRQAGTPDRNLSQCVASHR
jgi:tetratricopeptide (TPR) repeat protein